MHFTLRPWTINDLDSLVKYANNPKIANNLTDQFPYPYKKENGERFISFASKGNPVHIFAIDIKGEAAGGIGIHPQEDVQRKMPSWDTGWQSHSGETGSFQKRSLK